MASKLDIQEIKHADDELMVIEGGQVIVHFSGTNDRNKLVMGTYKGGGDNSKVVFWGPTNSLPDEREQLISNNNIVPPLLATKRNIILGGGLMGYKEIFEDRKRIIEEVELPSKWIDFSGANEIDDEYLPCQANNLLKHGNIFTEFTRKGNEEIAAIKAHECRHTRAQQQDKNGIIPNYFLYGQWGKITDEQKIDEKVKLTKVPAYDRTKKQAKFMMQCADKLLGGPYYYMPHYEGSMIWIKLANCIPEFHLSNLQNGFNIRYVIKVPEDYFLKSLSDEKRKDETKIKKHLKEAKVKFKNKLNKFLAGAKNAGRGLIITKHFYKHLQKEWPELDIIPLQVDLKDEAMLKLFESSNTAMTSSHGTPPALAGIATGAKMTSGSEIRNLYNFFQLTATPIPRRIISKPLRYLWLELGLPPEIKLGFRNIEMTTTDKNPTGTTEPIPQAA